MDDDILNKLHKLDYWVSGLPWDEWMHYGRIATKGHGPRLKMTLCHKVGNYTVITSGAGERFGDDSTEVVTCPECMEIIEMMRPKCGDGYCE